MRVYETLIVRPDLRRVLLAKWAFLETQSPVSQTRVIETARNCFSARQRAILAGLSNLRYGIRAIALCGSRTGLAEEQTQPVVIAESGTEFAAADAVVRRAVVT